LHCGGVCSLAPPGLVSVATLGETLSAAVNTLGTLAIPILDDQWLHSTQTRVGFKRRDKSSETSSLKYAIGVQHKHEGCVREGNSQVHRACKADVMAQESMRYFVTLEPLRGTVL
jgi:hypothetical protein